MAEKGEEWSGRRAPCIMVIYVVYCVVVAILLAVAYVITGQTMFAVTIFALCTLAIICAIYESKNPTEDTEDAEAKCTSSQDHDK